MTLYKSIFRICLRVVILTVYIVFFTVQIFFNFASGKNVFSSNHLYSSVAIAKTAHISQNPKTSSHLLGFRLNKHFQPQSLPSGLFSIVKIPIVYVAVKNIPAHSVDFKSSPFYLTSSLRGPPQMNIIS
jgi:hypothetical protein